MQVGSFDLRTYLRSALPFIILTVLAFVVYANSYQHTYPRDAGHAIVDNTAIRSLKNIPAFFTDAHTSSSLAANIDYRPITLITYAFNYAISGYETWSWHLIQILLHSLFACFFYLFSLEICRRYVPTPSLANRQLLALLPALIYVAHPTASGVVNYLCARTTLLSSSLLMMAFYYALQPRSSSANKNHYHWYVVMLYALALFCQGEAIAALAVFYFLDILQRQTITSPWHNLTSPLRDSKFCRRYAPFLLVSIGYFMVRLYALSDYNTASQVSHSSLTYLSTQITTAWFYLYHWFVPTRLIADDLTYPVYQYVWQPEVLLALLAWAMAFTYLVFNYKRYPVYFYLALSYLAILSPTSSFLPLQEIVNEHRPYLPVALASLIWILPAGNLLLKVVQNQVKWQRYAMIAVLLLVGIFARLTFQRNTVYLNNRDYWQDVVQKAPSSSAYLNYALALNSENRKGEGEHYLLRAYQEAPKWSTVHINLGELYQHKGDMAKAREHYDLAVKYDAFTTEARLSRAGFFSETKEYALALEDYTAALPHQANKFPIYRSMATAYAGVNDWQQALYYTNLMYTLDPLATEYSIVGISTPFFLSYHRTQSGINFFERLKELLPGREWIHINIQILQSRLGATTTGSTVGSLR